MSKTHWHSTQNSSESASSSLHH